MGRALFLWLVLSASAHATQIRQLPDKYVHVPIVRQQTEYSCGAAASLALLRYWKAFDGVEQDLYEDLETDPVAGTDPRSIVAVMKGFGLDARIEEGLSISDLRTALAADQTLIVDLQAWRADTKTSWKDRWEDGHYVVAVAIDKHRLYVMDPSTSKRYAYVPLTELMDRWHDYTDAGGEIWRLHQMAIFVEGENPDKSFRAPKRVSRMP